jgi:hypothetical protein
MAEVEKMRVEKYAERGFRGIRERIDKTITHEICPALAEIDVGQHLGE